ncbi:hypothetical protein D3C87_2009610 [compost metagenome]
MRRAFDRPGYFRQASSSSFSGYFLLIGTSMSRKSSFTACSEIASMTPISSPVRKISGTMPEVDSVTRRFDSDRPSPSVAIKSAVLTFSKL